MRLPAKVVEKQAQKAIDGMQRALEFEKTVTAHGDSLTRLAVAFGSDKHGGHRYTTHYERHFAPYRNENMSVWEIGIGGYNNPRAGGASLRMWKAWFQRAKVIGIDIFPKSYHDELRIKTYQGSQTDEDFLRDIVEDEGAPTIVIDDGSHMSEDVIKSFCILFPLLNHGGMYVIEDLQTSYWDEVGGIEWGGNRDRNYPHTSMNFFKRLVDGLNYEEFMDEDYQPTYFDRNIKAITFYHNLCFIEKGDNREGSTAFGKRYDS